MVKSLAALLCVVTLAACGGGKEEVDKSQADAWKDSYPPCEAIWQVGKKLPANYEYGCLHDGDSLVDTAYTACADGKRRLFVHHVPGGKNTHIAITGSEIRPYNGKTQSAAYAECLRPAE